MGNNALSTVPACDVERERGRGREGGKEGESCSESTSCLQDWEHEKCHTVELDLLST